MARTVDQIKKSLIDSIDTSDPSLDSTKGPIADIMVTPLANELSRTEAETARVAQLYSIAFASAATSDEVTALANNFGITQGAGQAATGFGYFMRFTKPKVNETFEVVAGTLVGTQDLNFIFTVTTGATLDGANADSYYNPSRGTYEVLVGITATAPGPDYNLPALRINRILTTTNGFDSFENRVVTDGGTTAETQEQEVARIQTAFLGRDSGSVGGIDSQVRNYSPELVLDVSIIQPLNRKLFTRPVADPALDIYIIGESIKTANETFIASGGETSIQFSKKPVRSIESFLVNNASIPYQFVQDTSFDSGYSARATDYIAISAPLNPNDVVQFSYTYNALIYNMQTDMFSTRRLFETDILVRESKKVYVVIDMTVKYISSYDPYKLQNSILQEIISVVQPNQFITVLQPEVVKQLVRGNVAGIQSIIFNKFTTQLSSTQNVEVIEFEDNEESVVDSNSIVINLV